MSRKTIKMIHEGDYAAEIEVNLIDEGESGWSHLMTSGEAKKLDKLRRAPVSGDLKTATSITTVYRLHPIL